MTLYTVIDNKEQPFNLLLGEEGVGIQQDIIFSSQVHSGQRLPEGKWEYRRYANGAIALVCADRANKLVVETNAGDSLLLTPEAISLSANLLVLQERADEQSRRETGNSLRLMHIALREALIRDFPSILVTSISPQVEARQPNSQREVRISPHVEAESIVLMTS